MDVFLRVTSIILLTSLLSACGGSSGGSSDNQGKSSAVALSSQQSTSQASSLASSSAPTVYCGSYPICETDNHSWQFSHSGYCISKSFCPAHRVSLPSSSYPERLVNPSATQTAQNVFEFLNGIYGDKMLSGQMDLTWMDSIDMAERVYADTQKYPAIMGFDFMNYGMTADWAQGQQQTEEAIDYWNAGGLVTFAWHWRDPSKLGTSEVNSADFYTTSETMTHFRIPVKDGQLDTSSAAFSQINAGIDLIAKELLSLQDAGVPVLWRPLHEAAGGWFWWGASRQDNVPPAFAQILLWRHLYDRLTHHHGLNNLIWVWNGQDALWYPGDEYVDIMGYDIYANNHQSQLSTFKKAEKFSSENKMVALTETGRIPDPTLAFQDEAHWLWFMVWNDTDKADHKDNFWSVVNSLAHRQAVYRHERVLSRDDLPDFKQ